MKRHGESFNTAYCPECDTVTELARIYGPTVYVQACGVCGAQLAECAICGEHCHPDLRGPSGEPVHVNCRLGM